GLSHRAFEHIAHPELSPDPLHIDGLALVGEARIAGDDEEPFDTRQRGDDFLDHAVGEIFLVRVAAHVLEWQNRDRGFMWQSKGRRDFERRKGWGSLICGGPNSVDPYKTGDVFEALLAEILERNVELTRYVLLHPSGHTDAARIGQGFQPRGNIYPVAENI